jgi:PAS domain S-box-containing protein
MDVNKATEQITGEPRERLIGTDFCDYFTEPDKAREGYQQVFSKGFVKDYPLSIRHTSGNITDVLYNASVFLNEKGEVQGVFAAARDITELKKADAVIARQSEIVSRQANEILEISTPVIQLWKGVLVTPLIGTLDSERTQHFMERLLQRIVDTDSETVLVDITGVPAIDTGTAQHLIDTITAVKLLGAQVILTGVRPAIAQTLIHLGIDLTGIRTSSSLAIGLQMAINLSGTVMKNNADVTKEK